ncbi:YbfB/YjiJ family MFS transporter [uncultured Methylovirgula sp.]|uniref:YbfB/YjiJ family MFS transporter n=1 Tax=uncultured Methylovirgula sp. TaxID=1285960 RepID=UPI0026045FD9|nr:YbfB/YjiJ family MFS transporter [uncultured Methylovirgula sp.]
MDKKVAPRQQQHDISARRTQWAILSAFCASLVGIGLARFAYTPLLPVIVNAHWFGASAAAYLGAANLAGYLAGALLGRPLAARMPAATALRFMMGLATAAFFACAYPVSFLWFFVWRFIAGLSGGVLMVLAAPSVLPHVAAARRGLAGGLIFVGVGVGIVASGTLVPLLLHQGLTATWLGLGILSLALTLIAWGGWPQDPIQAASAPAHRRPHRAATLRALYIEYALNAAGLVPHMIFLVDFIARGLGQGLATGAEYWVLFGLGAAVGPLVSGHLADRTGFGPALRFAYLVQAGAVILPALGLGPLSLVVSSLVVGAFTPGIVPLVLGRVHELLAHHPNEQRAAWSTATVSFAVLQAGAAYGLSFVFARSGSYQLLFVIGSAALLLALTIDLVTGLAARDEP